MSSLKSRSPSSSYKELLVVINPNGFDVTTLKPIGDGNGVSTPLSLSSSAISLNGSVWPATAAASHAVLRMSNTTNQLEWSALTAADVTGAVSYTSIPYDLAGAILGKPTASAVVLRFLVVRSFTVPASLTGSLAKTATTATASTVLTLLKNGVSFGTITFAAGATSGTMAAASATTFAIGDVFTATAPATADSTFGDCEFTIMAKLT